MSFSARIAHSQCRKPECRRVKRKPPQRGVKAFQAPGEACGAATPGADGLCIVWDLRTYVRRTSLVGQGFAAVGYHPDESQLVTAGAPACEHTSRPLLRATQQLLPLFLQGACMQVLPGRYTVTSPCAIGHIGGLLRCGAPVS